MKVLKYSRQRESIKACLMGRKDHPTADAVYSSIREEFPNISLGTVYRNLNLLVELGEIQKLETERIISMPTPLLTTILSATPAEPSRTLQCPRSPT